MKKTLALVLTIIMALAVLMPIAPVFSGTHPCDATFAVKIEDQWSFIDSEPWYALIWEPDYGYCSELTVEVWALGVVDMYAYEFTLTWTDDYHIMLVDYEVNTDYWAGSIVVQPDTAYYISMLYQDVSNPASMLTSYTQVAVAIAPSTGFSGDALLATLTFHIVNDICWTVDYCDYWMIGFNVEDTKMSDSCSQPVPICDPLNGLLIWLPIQPEVYIEPSYESNCELPGKFTKTVYVANITKMHDMEFNLTWYNYGRIGAWKCDDPDYGEVFQQIKVEDVTVLMPGIIADYDYDWFDEDGSRDGWFWFKVWLKDVSPLQNGTFPIVEILFEKQDPWYCGRQPFYYYEQPHEWKTSSCYTIFWFEDSYISVKCPTNRHIRFGVGYGDTTDVCQRAIYWEYDQFIYWDFVSNVYKFSAVPGDLNLDGVVDITDILIEASMYGADIAPPTFTLDGVTRSYEKKGGIKVTLGWNAPGDCIDAWINFNSTHLYVAFDEDVRTLNPGPPLSFHQFAVMCGDGNIRLFNAFQDGTTGAVRYPVGGPWLPTGVSASVAFGVDTEFLLKLSDVGLACGSTIDIALRRANIGAWTCVWPGCSVGPGAVIAPVPNTATWGSVTLSHTWMHPYIYYDLNRDGVIDIFDLVIVTKNFGRSC